MSRTVTGRAVVVGAGIFGASIADRLVELGWAVELVEQYQPGHVRQSSGGASRLLRFGHGPDERHTRMVWEALDLWRRLETDSGENLFVDSGVAWFSSGGTWVRESADTLARLDIPAEWLEPHEVQRLFPSVNTSDLDGTLFESAAGVIRAAPAVRALVHRARKRGMELTLAPAHPSPDGAGVVVDGVVRSDVDAVVWACGPWLSTLFPELVQVRVTKQDVLFYGAGPAWAAPGVPGWIDYDAAMYGCGDIDGFGFKTGSDLNGETFDPDLGPRRPSQTNLERSRAYLAHRFPDLADAPLIHTRTCQYTSTPDTRWIVAPHPDHPSVWIVGGGSGHGFKHGPALGRYVASLIDGSRSPDDVYSLSPRSMTTGLRSDTEHPVREQPSLNDAHLSGRRPPRSRRRRRSPPG